MRRLQALICVCLAIFAVSAGAQEKKSEPQADLQEQAQTPDQQPEPAAGFERYPRLEVGRPLLLPPHTFEVRAFISYLATQNGFDNDGKSKSLPSDYDLFSADLGLGWAPFKWIEIGGTAPFFSGREVYAEGQNLGDLSAYGLFRLFQSQDRNKELAAQLRISFPTGVSNRMLTIKDKQFVPENLTTGDPSVDFFPGLQARWTIDRFAIRGFAEYGFRAAGKINYGIEGLDEIRDFAPGASFLADADFLYQLNSRFVLIGSLNYYQQAANELSNKSLDDAQEALTLIPGIQFQLDHDYDLFLNAGIPISGRNYPDGFPVSGGLEGRF